MEKSLARAYKKRAKKATLTLNRDQSIASAGVGACNSIKKHNWKAIATIADVHIVARSRFLITIPSGGRANRRYSIIANVRLATVKVSETKVRISIRRGPLVSRHVRARN